MLSFKELQPISLNEIKSYPQTVSKSLHPYFIYKHIYVYVGKQIFWNVSFRPKIYQIVNHFLSTEAE